GGEDEVAGRELGEGDARRLRAADEAQAAAEHRVDGDLEARKPEDDGGVAAEGDRDLAAADGGERLARRLLRFAQPAGDPRGEERAGPVGPGRPVGAFAPPGAPAGGRLVM